MGATSQMTTTMMCSLKNTINCITKKLSQRHPRNPENPRSNDEAAGPSISSDTQSPRTMSRLTTNTPRRKTGNQLRKQKLSTMSLVFSAKRLKLRGVLLCVALSLLVRETAASSGQNPQNLVTVDTASAT